MLQSGVRQSAVTLENKSPQGDGNNLYPFLKRKLQNRKTCFMDLSHQTFYGNLLDKLNMNEDDIDAMIDRTFDLEPFTSYNQLIDYLKTKPDRFTKKDRSFSPKKKLFKYNDDSDKLGKLRYVKEMLINVVKDDYEDTKHDLEYKPKLGRKDVRSVRERNLQRLNKFLIVQQRKQFKNQEVLQSFE